jgi:hypothetical protein
MSGRCAAVPNAACPSIPGTSLASSLPSRGWQSSCGIILNPANADLRLLACPFVVAYAHSLQSLSTVSIMNTPSCDIPLIQRSPTHSFPRPWCLGRSFFCFHGQISPLSKQCCTRPHLVALHLGKPIPSQCPEIRPKRSATRGVSCPLPQLVPYQRVRVHTHQRLEHVPLPSS